MRGGHVDLVGLPWSTAAGPAWGSHPTVPQRPVVSWIPWRPVVCIRGPEFSPDARPG
jgi:hypothetical protein